MDQHQALFARDLDELSSALKLVPRQAPCVQCDDSTELSCPPCKDGESCQFTVPLACSQCPQAVCMKEDADTANGGNNDSGGGGPNAGAIAGGVIGGIIVVSLLVYLSWRFLIKPKRSDRGHSMYDAELDPSHGSEKDAASRMTRRSSTHTVHSIASTVLTRASNIIQIAYIPGVTNRTASNDPGLLVPPVPPIPMQHAGNRDSANNDEQHFFVPGDLRDSTYSGLSGYSDQTSYMRTSYAPRSSIASTIYGKQAQVLTGQQGGLRAKPTMVSVKTLGTGSNGSTPPVPDVDFNRFGNGRPQSGASAFSVGSTFLNNANTGTATQARAQVVKVGGLKKIEIGSKASSSSLNSTKSPETGSEDSAPISDNAPPTVTVEQSPFSDPPEPNSSSALMTGSSHTLGAVPEGDEEEERVESSRRVSSTQRGTSPFGDEHATK